MRSQRSATGPELRDAFINCVAFGAAGFARPNTRFITRAARGLSGGEWEAAPTKSEPRRAAGA